jgi:spore maturation protein CgeB
VAQFFAEGRECAMFDGASEMAEKVSYYLEHPSRREAMAEAGHLRCLNGGNSVDDRARAVLAKVAELRGEAAPTTEADPYFAKAARAP